MTTTFSWNIANLERQVSDGYVYTAHWTVSATDEDGDSDVYSASAYGSVGLSRPDNLIPYEDLTEEIVVNWVKERLSETPEALEERLASQIEAQKHPTSASGLPWNG